MIKTLSYSHLRAKLATVLDQAGETLEPIIVERRGKPAIALIDANELSSMMREAGESQVSTGLSTGLRNERSVSFQTESVSVSVSVRETVIGRGRTFERTKEPCV
jgi:prevent-host-death family protein